MFLTLTIPSGEKIRINMNHIEGYGVITRNTYRNYSADYDGKTFLTPAGVSDESLYVVEESPECIDLMLARMIEVKVSGSRDQGNNHNDC